MVNIASNDPPTVTNMTCIVHLMTLAPSFQSRDDLNRDFKAMICTSMHRAHDCMELLPTCKSLECVPLSKLLYRRPRFIPKKLATANIAPAIKWHRLRNTCTCKEHELCLSNCANGSQIQYII